MVLSLGLGLILLLFVLLDPLIFLECLSDDLLEFRVLKLLLNFGLGFRIWLEVLGPFFGVWVEIPTFRGLMVYSARIERCCFSLFASKIGGEC